MNPLLGLQLFHFVVGLLERLLDLGILTLLVLEILLSLAVISSSLREIHLQLVNDVQVGGSNLLVVGLNVIVLFLMLSGQLFDSCIFLVFDLLDRLGSLVIHAVPQ